MAFGDNRLEAPCCLQRQAHENYNEDDVGPMSRKNRRKREKRLLARADKALSPVVAFTKYDHKAAVRQRMNQGTFGAASEVRDVIIAGDN
jgi:hypothetical protein